MKLSALLLTSCLCLTALTAAAQNTDAASKKETTKKEVNRWDSPEAVDTRINELHTKLKITAAQEDQWKKITEEMHDSAKAMKSLIDSREQGAKSMTAIDDLKSYGDIASLHADSMKKFIDVFTPLYNGMSDDQKKNADEVFRGHKEAKGQKK